MGNDLCKGEKCAKRNNGTRRTQDCRVISSSISPRSRRTLVVDDDDDDDDDTLNIIDGAVAMATTDRQEITNSRKGSVNEKHLQKDVDNDRINDVSDDSVALSCQLINSDTLSFPVVLKEQIVEPQEHFKSVAKSIQPKASMIDAAFATDSTSISAVSQSEKSDGAIKTVGQMNRSDLEQSMKEIVIWLRAHVFVERRSSELGTLTETDNPNSTCSFENEQKSVVMKNGADYGVNSGQQSSSYVLATCVFDKSALSPRQASRCLNADWDAAELLTLLLREICGVIRIVDFELLSLTDLLETGLQHEWAKKCWCAMKKNKLSQHKSNF